MEKIKENKRKNDKVRRERTHREGLKRLTRIMELTTRQGWMSKE